jgi:multidrug efflux pump subunit AcrA (membrane-fusion protein)
VPNEDQKLRPGQFARVTLIHEVRSNALTVPDAAIVPKGGGKALAARIAVPKKKRLVAAE